MRMRLHSKPTLSGFDQVEMLLVADGNMEPFTDCL